ncbi:MAG: dienelactone hydrolase family protein [Bacteroidota bacterium]
MRRTIVYFLLLTSFCLTYSQDHFRGQSNPPPRQNKWINIPVGNRLVRTFAVFPTVSYKTPAILLIHDNQGLTNWVKSFADQLAASGFIVLAPDLLSGLGPSRGGTSSFQSSDATRSAVSGMDIDQVVIDLSAISHYSTRLPGANGKTAAVGFGWGGTQAFHLAASNAAITASFVFYGTGPKESVAYQQIQIPVYGFYGSQDGRTNATVSLSQQYMRELGKIFEPVFYMGAGPNFMRRADSPGAPSAYLQAKEAALQRLVEILKDL